MPISTTIRSTRREFQAARHLCRPGFQSCALAEGDRRDHAMRIVSLIEAECADFRAALDGVKGRYVEASSPRPRPASSRRSCRTSTTIRSSAMWMRWAPPCRSNTRRSSREVSCCSSIAPTSRSSAIPRIATARSPTSSPSSILVVAAINRALRNIPRDKVRLHVCWGNYEGPHDRDVALRDILPAILQANVGAFFLPFANPRHAHEFKRVRRDAAARTSAADRRRDRHADEFRRAPGSRCRPDRAHRRRDRRRERVLAATDCGFDTSAGMGGSPRTSSGRSCARCATARRSRRGGCSKLEKASGPRPLDR